MSKEVVHARTHIAPQQPALKCLISPEAMNREVSWTSLHHRIHAVCNASLLQSEHHWALLKMEWMNHSAA